MKSHSPYSPGWPYDQQLEEPSKKLKTAISISMDEEKKNIIIKFEAPNNYVDSCEVKINNNSFEVKGTCISAARELINKYKYYMQIKQEIEYDHRNGLEKAAGRTKE